MIVEQVKKQDLQDERARSGYCVALKPAWSKNRIWSLDARRVARYNGRVGRKLACALIAFVHPKKPFNPVAPLFLWTSP